MSFLKKYTTIILYSLTISLIIFIILNYLSEVYVRNNPEILYSRDQRIDENTRFIREKLIPQEFVTEYYALENADDVTEMWEEFYSFPPIFESYTHFKTSPHIGKYRGVTDHGFRMVKEQGPWPVDQQYYNIFFFGGSTAYGVGPYWTTIASYLQEHMNNNGSFEKKKVRVYNFGRSGYQSSQQSILLQRILLKNVPDMVVFFDFLNDFCWTDGNPASWTFLERYFNDYNKKALEKAYSNNIKTEWYHIQNFIKSLTLFRLTHALLNRLNEKPLPEYAKLTEQRKRKTKKWNKSADEDTLKSVIIRYNIIKKQVEALGQKFNFKTFFVAQPVPLFKYDRNYHFFNPDILGCHINSEKGYPTLEKFYKEGFFGNNFLWAADLQEDKKENLYVDSFHYTANFSSEIASFISKEIINNKNY